MLEAGSFLLKHYFKLQNEPPSSKGREWDFLHRWSGWVFRKELLLWSHKKKITPQWLEKGKGRGNCELDHGSCSAYHQLASHRKKIFLSFDSTPNQNVRHWQMKQMRFSSPSQLGKQFTMSFDIWQGLVLEISIHLHWEDKCPDLH